MLKIRLARIGAKKKPTYRVVVIEDWRSRNSRCIEVVGQYDPLSEPAKVKLEQDRLDHWIKCGAQPSDTVTRLMKSHAAAAAAAPAAPTA